MKDPVVIVGAGLSGLYAASLLNSQGVKCTVLEARNRIGGRALSVNMPHYGGFDLGPTWFWPDYEPTITNLIKKLNLESFVQYNKGAMLSERYAGQTAQRFNLGEDAFPKSMRIVGGVRTLIEAVASTLPPETVELDTRVTSIQMNDDGTIKLETEHANGMGKSFRASAVILALPPRIVARNVSFTPVLPTKLLASLNNKPTWMASQAKAIAIYERPFWREEGLSGFVNSMVGPLQEIHDASPDTGSGALVGFFRLPASVRQALGEKKVLDLVVDQLERLFGPVAGKPSALLYKDWSSEPETAVEEDQNSLRDFPNYGLPIGAGVWDKKIIFAGTETSQEQGGHLEGALRSAERAILEILS